MAKPPVNWNNVSMLTKGMKNLGMQINAWATERYGDSDGALGNYQHTLGKSGHNPDDTSHHNAEWDGDPDNIPEIRAIDVDIDFNNGVSAQTLVDHIVALKPSSVLRYVIYNRKIYEASNGWRSRTYTGASPHTEHIHFSGAYTQASDNNTTYDYKLGDIPVALTSADKTWITNTIAAQTKAQIVAQIPAIAKQVLDQPAGHPTYSYRTVRNFVLDVWGVRDYVINPDAAESKSAVSKVTATSPIAQITASAKVFLAQQTK